MLENILIDEKNKTKRNTIIKYSGLIISIVILLLSSWMMVMRMMNRNFDGSIIYSEKDRNVQKFYRTFKEPAIGEKATLFRLRDIRSDKMFDLGEKRDKSILIIFQVTNCPNCIAIEGELRKIQEKDSSKVEIVTVGVEKKDKVLPHLDEYNIDRLWLYDENTSVSKAYRVDMIPALYLLDNNNVIKYIGSGFVNAETIEQYF